MNEVIADPKKSYPLDKNTELIVTRDSIYMVCEVSFSEIPKIKFKTTTTISRENLLMLLRDFDHEVPPLPAKES